MPAHVQAVIAREKGAPVTLETVVIPDPGPGEAVVRVQACGVCHTDLHYREGGISDAFPFLLGHEAAGVVDAVGPGVTSVGPGDFVVLNWRAVCGRVPVLSARASPVLLFDAQRDAEDDAPRRHRARARTRIGAFAEKTLVAAGQCTKVDPAARPEAVGLLGCGVMAGFGAAMFTGEVGYGDSVAVFGCGGVGCAAVAGAVLAGATTVIAVDLDQRKLDLARAFGATDLVDASAADPVERCVRSPGATGGRLHRGGGQPGGDGAGLLRPRPGRHPRPGRRPDPRDAHRPADDRVLRPGRPAEAELVRGLPALP